jgi:hypothetical protein
VERIEAGQSISQSASRLSLMPNFISGQIRCIYIMPSFLGLDLVFGSTTGAHDGNKTVIEARRWKVEDSKGWAPYLPSYARTYGSPLTLRVASESSSRVASESVLESHHRELSLCSHKSPSTHHSSQPSSGSKICLLRISPSGK